MEPERAHRPIVLALKLRETICERRDQGRDGPHVRRPPETEDTNDNHHKNADAGTDASIQERLQRNPESSDARLDNALDESMDGSDPPASTQPVHRGTEPAPSSGYDPEVEQKLVEGQGS